MGRTIPAERGYKQVMLPDSTAQMLDARKRGDESYSAVIVRLCRQQQGAEVPWQAIEAALLEQFGLQHRAKIAAALTAAGMP